MIQSGRKMPVIPCGVGLVRRGREFLIAQRKEGDSFGSLWEFPGGKKEPGETFEECIAREIREELGVEVCVGKKFMELRRRHRDCMIWLNFYLCSHVSGEPRPLECQQVQWAGVEELKNFSFPPANEEVIRRLLKDF